MPDDISRPTKRSPAQTGQFGAAPGVRVRQLAPGGWEVGGDISKKEIREERIRVRAYFLWETAGRPDGVALEFWLAAEKLDVTDGAAETASKDREVHEEVAKATDPGTAE